MEAPKRVLKYLKGIMNEGLSYPFTSDIDIKMYSDVDWAGPKDDRRSTLGYLSFAGSKLISWSSKKQPTVALSSIEGEYRALANATQEAMWLKQLYAVWRYNLTLQQSLETMLAHFIWLLYKVHACNRGIS
ncbi:hypothetical protein KP509_1Z253200 [Ceratopteris richardii]|nr:hypothetical protein KP509_1Z253200 [Ceratopteris richardii]